MFITLHPLLLIQSGQSAETYTSCRARSRANLGKPYKQNELLCTCSGNNMEQHLHLTCEESPGAVGKLPAYHVALLTWTHHLAQHSLWHPQVCLACA